MATDPKGKAILIAAVESTKMVFSFHQTKSKSTINGPLSIDSPNTIIFDVASVETSSKSQIFASLEHPYRPEVKPQDASKTKVLNFYKVDWDRNETSLKISYNVDSTAHKLISLPSSLGFGGVLILAKDKVIYRSIETENEIIVAVPKRYHTVAMDQHGNPDHGVYFVHSQCISREGSDPFVLLQTEYGDLFKISLVVDSMQVTGLGVEYFDTVPPSTVFCVLENEYLYNASESGNHFLYTIQTFDTQHEKDDSQYIKVQPLKNLVMIDEVKSACPVVDMKIENALGDETSNQLVTLSGRGPRSTLRVLVHGIDVDVVLNHPIEANPIRVWTLKQSLDDALDRYLVLSYADSTSVLTVENGVVSAITKSYPFYNAFVMDQPTLDVGLFVNGIIQIVSNSIRYTRGGKTQEWSPSGKTITHSTFNEKQILVVTNNGDIFYLEADGTKLKEVECLHSTGKEINSIAIHPMLENDQKSSYFATTDSELKLRLYSLNSSNLLEVISTQQLPARSNSLSFLCNSGYNCIVSGSTNGILTRFVIDDDNHIGEPQNKYIGSKAIKIKSIIVNGKSGLLCMSKKAWMLFSERGSHKLVPISCGHIEDASSIQTENNLNAIITISSNTLKVFVPSRIGEMFTHLEMPLRYTPRKSTIIPSTKNMVLVEADHNAYSHNDVLKLESEGKDSSMEIEGENNVKYPHSLSGVPKPGPLKWASCIRVVDLFRLETLDLIELEDNEAAISVCHVSFRDHGNDIFICVGVTKDMVVYPKRKTTENYIYVYRFIEETRKLELESRMRVDGLPSALAPYQGRLLVGIGSSLLIYDLGKVKSDLIKKCENSSFPNVIVTISTFGERIIVGDIQESLHYVKYNRPDNSLTIIVDDVLPRWITCSETLDYSTVAGSDKFGNIFLLRVPDKVAHFENDLSSSRFSWETGHRNGAPYKLECICSFYTGETVTNVKKAQLTQGCAEVLIYTTITGTVGALIPLASRGDVDFFARLELLLRQECPSVSGRDHLSFRSSFFPLKNVIDGDLCEMFASLDQDKQRYIAEELEISPIELQRKLEEIRENV